MVQTASVFRRASYLTVSGIVWPEREADDKNDCRYACIHPRAFRTWAAAI